MLVNGDRGKGKLQSRTLRVGDSVYICLDSKNIGVPVAAGKSMGTCTEGQVGKPAPVLEVVAALVIRFRPIRDFILNKAARFQGFTQQFVHLSGEVRVRQR